jgi:hypothetical protein
MPMPKTLRRPGRKRGDDVAPDDGCQFAPACQTCPWRACDFTLPAPERRIFALAHKTLQTFRAAPERTIPR